jgi:uncharacterized membrane protein (UPF0136 family)
MAQSRPSAAGGFPIAIGSLVGTVVGYRYDQATLGFLAGLCVGIAVAVAIWLLDRK